MVTATMVLGLASLTLSSCGDDLEMLDEPIIDFSYGPIEPPSSGRAEDMELEVQANSYDQVTEEQLLEAVDNDATDTIKAYVRGRNAYIQTIFGEERAQKSLITIADDYVAKCEIMQYTTLEPADVGHTAATEFLTQATLKCLAE